MPGKTEFTKILEKESYPWPRLTLGCQPWCCWNPMTLRIHVLLGMLCSESNIQLLMSLIVPASGVSIKCEDGSEKASAKLLLFALGMNLVLWAWTTGHLLGPARWSKSKHKLQDWHFLLEFLMMEFMVLNALLQHTTANTWLHMCTGLACFETNT